MSQVQAEPRSPMPAQHQEKPGVESKVSPKPKYEAPLYKGSDKLKGQGRADHRRRFGHRSGGRRAVRARRGRRRDRLPARGAERRRGDPRAVEARGAVRCSIAGDVRDAAFCRQAVEQTVERVRPARHPGQQRRLPAASEGLEDITEEQWDRTFRTNIYGYFHMVKAALPHLKPGGAIVNTGSITGLEGSKQLLDYSATKGGDPRLHQVAGAEPVEKRIRVNCVAPGPVWTPLNPADKAAGEGRPVRRRHAVEAPAQPEEIAPAFVFFASEADSSYITGEVLTLLGGETAAA